MLYFHRGTKFDIIQDLAKFFRGFMPWKNIEGASGRDLTNIIILQLLPPKVHQPHRDLHQRPQASPVLPPASPVLPPATPPLPPAPSLATSCPPLPT